MMNNSFTEKEIELASEQAEMLSEKLIKFANDFLENVDDEIIHIKINMAFHAALDFFRSSMHSLINNMDKKNKIEFYNSFHEIILKIDKELHSMAI